MKIFMYSDIHISRTSSIMPMIPNSKYTYRQEVINQLGKYIRDVVLKENVDVIVNLGDTFDQHTITSYDVDVASNFFANFKDMNIPHYVLVGNHEMINQDFNAVSLLKNINNITVIEEPTSLDITVGAETRKLAFLPYQDYKEIIEFPEGDYLFSHNDIQGTYIRGNFELPDGIEPSFLKTKYKLVFNGHIHAPSIKENIVTVGSAVSHSFSDDSRAVPQCCMYDTLTMEFKIFKPTFTPLFRKIEINEIDNLLDYLKNENGNYKYILQVVCPYDLKQKVKEILETDSKVLASRINVKVTNQNIQNDSDTTNIEIQSNVDIDAAFKEFIDTVELKFPKEMYLEVIK